MGDGGVGKARGSGTGVGGAVSVGGRDQANWRREGGVQPHFFARRWAVWSCARPNLPGLTPPPLCLRSVPRRHL